MFVYMTYRQYLIKVGWKKKKKIEKYFISSCLRELKTGLESFQSYTALLETPMQATCEWKFLNMLQKSKNTQRKSWLLELAILLPASLMAAKSTTAGTPVKSCKITRPGLKGISTFPWFLSHAKIFCTSSSEI